MNPGYKQTEVGVIPEEWEVKRLKRISPSQSVGLVINPSTYFDRAGTVPLLVGSNISQNTIEWTTASRITKESNDLLPASRLVAGDLVTVRVGEPGVTAVVPSELDGCNCASMMIVRRHPSFDSHWLCWMMNSQHGRRQVEHVQYGTAQKQFNISHAVDFIYPVPPLPEQRAIATALSDVDGLLGGLERLIAKKRDLKQAAMQQLLTAQTRLPGFHGAWQVKAIHELSQVGRGRVISHTEISKSFSPTYPVFSSQTSDSGIMGYLDTYDFEGDYVTWTTDGANAGTVFARSGRFNCTNVCGTIKLHGSDHRFIAATLGRVTQAHVSRHLGNPKLMNDVMKKIQITIPKTRAEQTAIAEVLSEMDGELAALEERREKTRALKQSMMQALLTGRIRLV